MFGENYAFAPQKLRRDSALTIEFAAKVRASAPIGRRTDPKMSKRRKIDETDLRILKRLQLDARVSNVRLAEDVHLSPSACLDRTRSLEADGVIARYVTEFDLRRSQVP